MSLSTSSVLPISTMNRSAPNTSITTQISILTTTTITISQTSVVLTSDTSMSYNGTQSFTTQTQVTLLNDSYVEFTLSGNYDYNINQSVNDTARALLQIFLQCFPAARAQQIEITFRRARTLASAYIRLFNTPTLSAQTLYQGISQQLSDPSSQLRQNQMTAQLTRDSIVNTKTWYYCASNIVQETPCSSSMDKLSLATVIVPSVIGGVLLFGGIILLFILVRRRSHKMTHF
ncbi:hypothetical protein I4U23_004723 [Adineta vaga]|nr:hypothetical protein I4U23_004723 [Adineta vaga]